VIAREFIPRILDFRDPNYKSGHGAAAMPFRGCGKPARKGRFLAALQHNMLLRRIADFRRTASAGGTACEVQRRLRCSCTRLPQRPGTIVARQPGGPGRAGGPIAGRQGAAGHRLAIIESTATVADGRSRRGSPPRSGSNIGRLLETFLKPPPGRSARWLGARETKRLPGQGGYLYNPHRLKDMLISGVARKLPAEVEIEKCGSGPS